MPALGDIIEELDVWVGGVIAGRVEQQRDGGLRFTYDRLYRENPETPSLSLSMPKAVSEHGPDIASPWFDNLLPDDDGVRARWATQFGERRVTAFNLLKYMGEDCAGAVQVMPAELLPDQSGTLEPVSTDEIAERLRVLRADESTWNPDRHGGRWSLGGAQGKFALARGVDGAWYAPNGRAASTHIFKVGIVGASNGDTAEFVTMRAAHHMRLPVAGIDLVRYSDGRSDELAMVVERYDRRPVSTSTGPQVLRLHQEDLCQATGTWRTAKYQNDDGPSPTSIVQLLEEQSNSRDLEASKREFARALAFNWAVAGIDAHAKNYSVLMVADRIRLAPLYDLTSASLLMDPKEVHYKTKSAMKIGRDYSLRGINRDDLHATADAIGVGADWFIWQADVFTTGAVEAFERGIDDAKGLILPETKDKFLFGIRDRVTRARNLVGLAPANRETTISVPEPPIRMHRLPPAQRGGDVTVRAHSRGGKPVPPHTRRRPSR